VEKRFFPVHRKEICQSVLPHNQSLKIAYSKCNMRYWLWVFAQPWNITALLDWPEIIIYTLSHMETFFGENVWVIFLIMLWVLPWKGYALWSAAKLSHKWWFIILLVLNTLAILDIIYIFFVVKRGKILEEALLGKGGPQE